MSDLAHEHAGSARDEAPDARRKVPAGSHDAAVSAAAATGSISRLSPAGVSRLQRSAGTRAVARAIGAERLAVQRHAEGTELPTKEEDVAEVTEKENAEIPTETGAPVPGEGTGGEGAPGTGPTPTDGTPPSPTPGPEETPPAQTESNEAPPAATRTKKDERTEKAAGLKAGKTFQKNQKLNPGAMSLAGAESILQGQYGGLKKIVPGTIVILADQPACAAKYDEVCIADHLTNPDTGQPWAPGDCAKGDAKQGVLTQGFAWKGVVYVNGKTDLVTATAHEILHNNTAGDFRGKVGETFNEGVTEYLARKALKASGVKVPSVTAYPTQVKLTKLLIAFVGEDTVQKAYFGGADSLIKAFEDKSATTWATLKTDAEALAEPKVKKAMKKKKKK
jgi:hypothetical protein